MEIRDTHYFVWVDAQTYWSVYMHVRRGTGRAARRKLTAVYHIEKPQGPHTSPELVRLLADAMECQLGIHLHGSPCSPASPGGP